jgi:hypothetical protein
MTPGAPSWGPPTGSPAAEAGEDSATQNAPGAVSVKLSARTCAACRSEIICEVNLVVEVVQMLRR